VPFALNVRHWRHDDLQAAFHIDSDPFEADAFWIVYLLGGYQPGIDHDADPNSENSVPGVTDNQPYNGSLIFLETARDACHVHGWDRDTLEQQVVAHEVGHQVLESVEHTAHTIMQAIIGPPLPPEEENFSDEDIATIRNRQSSPGS
jgi:hypothetical protein